MVGAGIFREEGAFKARKTLNDIPEAEIRNYRLIRERLREVIDGYEASVFSNSTDRSKALSAETQVRAFHFKNVDSSPVKKKNCHNFCLCKWKKIWNSPFF